MLIYICRSYGDEIGETLSDIEYFEHTAVLGGIKYNDDVPDKGVNKYILLCDAIIRFGGACVNADNEMEYAIDNNIPAYSSFDDFLKGKPL